MPATIAGSTVMPVEGRSSVTQFGLMRIVSFVSKQFSALDVAEYFNDIAGVGG